jgi:hypothetical protein
MNPRHREGSQCLRACAHSHDSQLAGRQAGSSPFVRVQDRGFDRYGHAEIHGHLLMHLHPHLAMQPSRAGSFFQGYVQLPRSPMNILEQGGCFRFQDAFSEQLARVQNHSGDRCLVNVQPNILAVILRVLLPVGVDTSNQNLLQRGALFLMRRLLRMWNTSTPVTRSAFIRA